MSPVVRRGLVMQPQQIHAVVVAVWRPHDGMDVKFFRLGIVEHNAFVLIEFDHHHRTLNAIIESAVFAHAAGPAEMGLPYVAFDILHAGRKRTGRQGG